MLCLMASSVSYMCVPFATSVHLYWATQALAGLSHSGLGMASLSWLVDMWPKDSVNPVMQAFYLSLYVGAMVAPLITAPFLSKVPASDPDVNHKLISNSSDPCIKFLNQLNHQNESHIIIPYTIISGAYLMATLAHLLAYFCRPYVKQERTDVEYEELKDESDSRTGSSVVTKLLLGSFLLACLEGAAFASISYLPTYAVLSDLRLSKSQAALVSSLGAGSTVVTLFASSFLAVWIKSRDMLYMGSGVFLLANACLFFASSHSLDLSLASVVGLGFGYSIFSPNTFSFLSSLLTLTNPMFGLLTFMKSAGRTLATTLTGTFIEDHPNTLIYTNITCLLIAVPIIIFFHIKD